MPIRVNREAFLATLSRARAGLSKRGTIEQSKCFLFQSGWLLTFNNETCVRTTTDLPEDFECAVAADPLYNWVEAVTDGELELSLGEGRVNLKAGTKRSWVRTEAKIAVSLDDVSLPERWAPLPEEFLKAVEQVIGTAGGPTEEFRVRCVHVHPEYLETCDRRQATRYHLDTKAFEPFLVLAESLSEVPVLGPTRFAVTADWVHFRNKTTIFSARRHTDAYPTDSVTALLDYTGPTAVLPRGAETAAKLGSVFADKKDEKLRVTLTRGQMVVSGTGAHGGCETPLPMTYDGPDTEFTIRPKALAQLVKNHDKCQLGEGRLKVIGDKWEYCCALGRPAGSEVVPRTRPPEEMTDSEEPDDRDLSDE